MAGVIALAVVAWPAGAENAGPDCNGLKPTITGGNAPEWLTGTEGDDVIRAGAGDDTVNGLGGNDVICAGPGNDTSRGGPGNDLIRSGRGNDSSSGESGDDTMFGQGDGDIADGGTGVDGCLFETHEQCEADLDVNITGPANATRGGPGVSIYNASLVNHGPTPAVNSRVDFDLPDNAVFIAGSSDPRCTALSVTEVRCILGAMGLEAPDSTFIGVNFTGCTNPVSRDIGATAEDPRTNDPVAPNTTDSQTTALAIDPSCAVAVDDAVSVPHDSGANVIDVLANDNNPQAVATTTNGAHGAVAIANGGANVTYTPDAGYCGSDTFTYTINPGGSQATVTVTIPCPDARDDAFNYFCEGAQEIDVLFNDINPPGGGPIKVIAVMNPTTNGGTATIINGGAAVTYDSNGSFQDDSFTYTITGGDTATVTITNTCGS